MLDVRVTLSEPTTKICNTLQLEIVKFRRVNIKEK